MLKVSTDKAPNWPVIAVLKPSPREIKETTAAIPIKIPRRVSQLLSFLFFILFSDRKKRSFNIV
jgi:hypothetical protein